MVHTWEEESLDIHKSKQSKKTTAQKYSLITSALCSPTGMEKYLKVSLPHCNWQPTSELHQDEILRQELSEHLAKDHSRKWCEKLQKSPSPTRLYSQFSRGLQWHWSTAQTIEATHYLPAWRKSRIKRLSYLHHNLDRWVNSHPCECHPKDGLQHY